MTNTRKTIKYKGFYLNICDTGKEFIGSIYSKNYRHDYYYQNIHMGFLEDKVLEVMKDEVDKFINRRKTKLAYELQRVQVELDSINKKIGELDFDT